MGNKQHGNRFIDYSKQLYGLQCGIKNLMDDKKNGTCRKDASDVVGAMAWMRCIYSFIFPCYGYVLLHG